MYSLCPRYHIKKYTFLDSGAGIAQSVYRTAGVQLRAEEGDCFLLQRDKAGSVTRGLYFRG
jgi:hypothetical protein